MRKTYFLMILFAWVLSLDASGESTPKETATKPLPYACNFATQAEFDEWTVINTNNDDRTWVKDASTESARYSYSFKLDADDWLISPPIRLESGKKYRVRYAAKGQDKYTSESLKVYYGQGVTIEAQTANLLADHPKLPLAYDPQSVLLSPDVTGNYNIGFYACSKARAQHMRLTGIVVEVMEGNDMMGLSIYGQSMPKMNKEYSYKVKVKNNGASTESNYKVQLVDESGEILATTNIKEAIVAYETKDILVKWTPKKAGSFKLKGKVVLVGDQLQSNDETPAMQIEVQPDIADQWSVTGQGATPLSSPIDFWGKCSASQTLYLKEEIGFSGIIKKIVYSYDNNSNYYLVNHPLKIYMASTKLTKMDKGWIPETEMTLVYEGTFALPTGKGELEIALQNPFAYSGENLCIMFVHSLINDRYQNVRFIGTEIPETESRTRIYTGDVDFNWKSPSELLNSVANVKLFATTGGEGGKITGKVTHNGEALAAARVTIDPLGISLPTSETGDYHFEFVPQGVYTLTASKFDFEDVVKTDVMPSSSQPVTANFELNKREKYTVSGIVKDMDNVNVSEASVTIKGYQGYAATTDANGSFTINDVYKDNGYNLTITKEGLSTYSDVLNVTDANVSLNIQMQDILNCPLMVSAASSATAVNVNWGEPGIPTTFRYDDGVPTGPMGFSKPTFLENSVVGAAHKTPAVLSSMTWWIVGNKDQIPHTTVNVFVFDLDSEGIPTNTILFSKMNVPNRDNQWSKFNFPAPVECPNGFMIAVSYKGFLGLGHDSGLSQEFPFTSGTNYFSANYELIDFQEFGKSNQLYNAMIRADGYELKNAPAKIVKSMGGYKVWRLAETDQADESKWTLLTPVPQKGLAYTDNSWAAAATGSYKYAVKAVYSGNHESVPYFSNMVSKGMDTHVTVNISTNTATDESTGATVTLVNNDKNTEHVYKGTIANGKALISNVWKGVYTVKVTHPGFKAVEKAGISLTAEAPALSYELEQITVLPYNLAIASTEKESDRTFSWNAGNIEDDFEGHKDFTINSSKNIEWSYLDKDGVTTATLRDYAVPNGGKPMAYMILNPFKTTPRIDLGVFPEYSPHSGSKYLHSFPLDPLAPISNEDFIISPELSFSRDFIFSFWANGDGAIKVGYSTTGKEDADFTNWLTKGTINLTIGRWTEYRYTVPANAKYVTIKNISFQSSVSIDDIFIGIEPSKAAGQYEVYLDGNKIGNTSAASFRFNGLTNGNHTAGVKTIYTSGSTEMATISFNVNAESIGNTNTVSLNVYPNPVRNNLNIEGPYQWLEIYNATGGLVMKVIGENQINVSNLAAGVYIMKAYNDNHVGEYKIVKQQ